jgi:hypothetical protein
MTARSKPLYGITPFRANMDDQLTSFEFRVFSTMCGFANNETHLCWPKQRTLANLLHTSVSQISQTIARLVELGYVEIQKMGFPARNIYRIIWEIPPKSAETIFPNVGEPASEPSEPSDTADETCLPATEFTVGETQSLPASKHRVYRGVKSLNIPIEHTSKTPSSEVSLYSTSLAHSAESAPPTVTAPLTRTREGLETLDTTALKRDPLFVALVACLGREPVTRREWRQWIMAVNQLHGAGVKASEIPRAIQGFQATFPRATITPLALVNQWSLIREGKAHDLAQLEIHRRSAQVVHDADAERQHAQDARRAAERAEVDRLMAEWGYGARAGESPRG